MKKIKYIILIVTILTVCSCVISRSVTKYSYDIPSFYTFDEGLQICDVSASCDLQTYEFGLFRNEVKNDVNIIDFQIQGDNGPLKENIPFNITKVEVINGKKRLLDTTYISKRFDDSWYFDYTNRKLPKFVNEDLVVKGTFFDPYTKLTTAVIHPDENYSIDNEISLGSYSYRFIFKNKLKKPKEFKILIYYTYNLEEKILEINAKKEGAYITRDTYIGEAISMH